MTRKGSPSLVTPKSCTPLYCGAVRHFARRFGLLLKTTHAYGVGVRVLVHHLDGDVFLHEQMPCLIDCAHAAFSQQLKNLVTLDEDARFGIGCF